jgi:hypothetical protein
MKITFESSPTRFGFPFRIIGYEGRYDTLSDTEYIDDSHIICADRQMARLYLLQFDLSGNSYIILDSVECIVNGQPQHFELLSYRDGTVYSISYKNTLFSCKLKDNKFTEFQTVIVKSDEKYHGVLALPETDIVLITNMLRPTITEYNTKTGISRSIVCGAGVRMKDVAILDTEHMIALSSDNGPISGTRLPNGSVSPINTPYNSHILVLKRQTGQLVSKYTLEKTQIDGCAFAAGTCYVTCTAADGSGYILCCTFDSEYAFINVRKIPCAGFPHGVAVHGDIISYTSYSESALYIHTIKEFESLSR